MKLVVANHKMNLNFNDVFDYINKMKIYKDKFIVMPSNLYIKEFVSNGFKVGTQNIYDRENGFYTGEVSASQVKSIGAEYVLIGHSERRRLFNEDDELINKKIKIALKNGLKVIVCIGDEINQNVKDVLKKHIENDLKDINEEVIIAYEPVYAIGTGIIPKIEDIEMAVNYIKSLVNVKVLYGGSVNSSNITMLNKIENIDGYLVGSASLNSDEFIKILEVVD